MGSRRAVNPMRTVGEHRDEVGAYIDGTRRHALLSRDAEQSLALRYRRDGDQAAASRLVLANLRLVVKIANEYHPGEGSRFDLIQ